MKYLLHTHFNEIMALPPDLPKPQPKDIFALDASHAFHQFFWENPKEFWDYERDFADLRAPNILTWIEAPAPQASNNNNVIRPMDNPFRQFGCYILSVPLRQPLAPDLVKRHFFAEAARLLTTEAGRPIEEGDPIDYNAEQVAAIKSREIAHAQQQMLFGLTKSGEFMRLLINHYYLDSSGRMVGQSRGVILPGSRRIAALPFAMKRQLIKELEAPMLGAYYTLSLLAEGRLTLAPGDPPKRPGQIRYQRIKAVESAKT